MSTADTLLSRLDAVKRTGNETWMARCPAHQDRRPSLSIRETEDGRVLVHCFAGCGAYDVVAAVGLEFHDLYPPRPIDHAGPLRRPFPAADVLEAVQHESLIVALAAAALARGEQLPEAERQRLLTAAERLQAAGVANV